MKHDDFNQDDRIEVRIPYREITRGEAYFTLYKDGDMSKEEFLAGLRDGSIDPCAMAVEEKWTEIDSEFVGWQSDQLEDMNP